MSAALRMTGGVRWYEWHGIAPNGKLVRAQSRTMMASPLNRCTIAGQFVVPAGAK